VSPLHFQAIHDPILFAAAMASIAVNLGYLGMIQGKHRSIANWTVAGLAVWLGTIHLLDAVEVHSFAQQAPVLAALSLVIILASARLLRGERAKSAITAAHATLILSFLLSMVSVESTSELSEFFNSGAGAVSTGYAGVFFLELAVICYVTHRSTRGWSSFAGAILFSLASGWKLLVFIDLPEIWYGPLLAGVGLSLTIIERFRLAAAATTDSTTSSPSALGAVGDLSFVAGELIAFFQTLPWLLTPHSSIPNLGLLAVLLAAGFSIIGAVMGVTRSIRGWHSFAAFMIAASTLLAWLKTLQLADYQKLELVLEFLGLVWLMGGCLGRLKETVGHKNVGVSFALWTGSIAATAPVFVCMLMHRWSAKGPSLGDELSLITITSLMVAVGCILQIRATTSIGGLALGVYLAVLFGHLAYQPQIAVGVYLVAGGAVIFMTGVMLSVYRDRLLALPSKIANREGIFQMIDWR
jgi:hypothetical protein